MDATHHRCSRHYRALIAATRKFTSPTGTPTRFRFAVCAGVDFTRDAVGGAAESDVYLFVAPTNSRGNAVALAVRQAVDKVRGLPAAPSHPIPPDPTPHPHHTAPHRTTPHINAPQCLTLTAWAFPSHDIHTS
jgi:hypothetical protein